MELEELKIELKKYLNQDEKRYAHSIGVMKMCEKLAKIYGANVGEAKKVGLMHDLAKKMKEEESIKYIKENKIKVDKIELKIPKILHGKIAADICRKEYDFTDEMCNAIAVHSSGTENMTLLAKILYISDKIDETRTYADVEYYRNIAYKDIDEAIIKIIDYNITKFVNERKVFYEEIVRTRNYLLLEKEKREDQC